MIITISLLLLSTLYVLNYTYDQLLNHLLVDSIYYPPLSLLMVNIQNGEESLLFSKWGVYMRETGDIELYLLSDVGMHILLSKWSCSAFGLCSFCVASINCGSTWLVSISNDTGYPYIYSLLVGDSLSIMVFTWELFVFSSFLSLLLLLSKRVWILKENITIYSYHL